jgi:hypothetical protein
MQAFHDNSRSRGNREGLMKYFAVALVGILGLFYAMPDAKAYIACRHGYYWHRGGCVIVGGPPVVVAPPVVVGPPVVFAPRPRCYWAYGRQVCRP